MHVLGRRPDGYHELHSLFQAISLGDTVTFKLSDYDSLTCTDPDLPTDASNLVMKAVKLFRKKTGWLGHVKIHLEKKVPSQAGMGGGSSNAATTLWALNQLSGGSIPIDTLQDWSGEIGSDIPFFFSEGTAECFGRGEIVKSLPAPIAQDPFWIVKPSIHLSTIDVYKRYSSIPSRKTTEESVNDLEMPAFELAPELYELKKQLLDSGFERVLMTGSGSAFFCIGKDGIVPELPGISRYRVTYLNRSASEWYKG